MTDRLSPPFGSWIDRERPVRFRFDGRDYQGYAGDTLTTALWAAGVRVLGRSFKYHRPRGIYSLGRSDANCLVESRDGTNIRGDHRLIEEGLDVRSVNTVGSAERDWMAMAGWAAPFMPVGFYYKAFHTPVKLFPFYECMLRKAAGLGSIQPEKPFVPTPKDYDFCQVLVIGGGPSGLSAAVTAAEAGADVLLVDQLSHMGGSLWIEANAEQRDGLLRRANALGNLRQRTGTTAVSVDGDHWVGLVDGEKLTKLRAETIVFATGCHEQGAVFHNNDLPGVMLAEAALRLMYCYGVAPCKRTVIATANGAGYRTAGVLQAIGVEVAGVLDLRPGGAGPSEAESPEVSAPVWRGCELHGAVAARGKRGITGVRFASDAGEATLPCDGLILGTGYAPDDVVFRQAGGKMVYDGALEQFLPMEAPKGIFAAGRLNGVYETEDRVRDGEAAAAAAIAWLGLDAPEAERPARRTGDASHPYPVTPEAVHKAFVDFDEDVQVHDIAQSVQEGFESAELLKRYATVGMGPSQGKHSNLAALRILAKKRGLDLEGLQLTTARPYASPVPLGHLAGRCFTPRRRTAMHGWHAAHGAAFMYAGDWLRPEYYGRDGMSREACIAEEAKNLRAAVGMIDLSTLGKLEVAGPDAVAFIERTYTGRFAKLPVGKARYGILCDESGVLIEDGIVVRLAEDRFYLSTTTTGAASVYREMQRNLLLWGMEVRLVNLTGHFAAIGLAGPKYKEVLAGTCAEDLSDEAFPHLGYREITIADVPARVMRLGFVSESGYEIHVPASGALHVWEALMAAGAAHGLKPFGVEAQRLLRCEMGHLIIGRDTDALTHPFEVGLAWAMKMDKSGFVGKRSAEIHNRKDRVRTLVGFLLPEGHRGPVPQDCHLIIEGGDIVGRVTSVYHSPTVGRHFGLAFIHPDKSTPGTSFNIRVDGALIPATVSATPFV